MSDKPEIRFFESDNELFAELGGNHPDALKWKPWRLRKPAEIETSEGTLVCNTAIIPGGEAVAAHIVTAVNAHDALVEALKACLPFIDDALDAHTVMSDSVVTGECRSAVDAARAALRLAGVQDE